MRRKPGPKPKPASKKHTKTALSFPPGLHRRIKAQASAQGKSVSEFVSSVMERAVKRMEGKG